jgi:tetratricopeptide (TPR) repeat protein
MQDSKAHQLHAQSEEERELKHNFPAALSHIAEAILEYNNEGNLGGMAQAYASQAITYKHLGRIAPDEKKARAFFISAKMSALTGVKIGEETGNAEDATLPYYSAAKMLEEIGEGKEALVYFEKAVNSPLPPQHNRLSVRADMKNHLAACGYRNAASPEEKKEYYEQAKAAIQELLHSNEEDSYVFNVWLSGAYLRMADMLYSDNPEESKQYLEKAKEVIQKDSRLGLRQEQYELLKNNLRKRQMERFNKESIL